MERGAGAGAGAGAGYSSSEDEGGYGAGKELDARISSYPPLWWLVLSHLLLVVGFELPVSMAPSYSPSYIRDRVQLFSS